MPVMISNMPGPQTHLIAPRHQHSFATLMIDCQRPDKYHRINNHLMDFSAFVKAGHNPSRQSGENGTLLHLPGTPELRLSCLRTCQSNCDDVKLSYGLSSSRSRDLHCPSHSWRLHAAFTLATQHGRKSNQFRRPKKRLQGGVRRIR